MQGTLERAKQIKLIIFDVDGVLTDGGLYFDDSGQELKAFHSRDGLGMKMLKSSGVEIGIITGRTSQVVTHRMNNLGIEHVYQGQSEKLPAFQLLIEKLGVSEREVAYVGDDVVDLPIMRRVGLAVAVQDAHDWVVKHAHWQTPSCGGRGAARDICEFILEAQGNLESTLSQYL